MSKLTVTAVRAATRPGLHSDGGTLYLSVSPRGSKSWIQRITIDGRRRDIGLGGFPAVSLAKARQRALANRVAIADGIDPLAEKVRSKMPTFRQAAQATFEVNRPRWRDDKTARNWMQGMEKRVFPIIGHMRVNRIQREDVLRILTPIWTEHPDIARKLRQRIRTTFQWCLAHGYVDSNVAGQSIDGALPSMPATVQHFRTLPYRQVKAALKRVDTCDASESAKLCLRFIVLTAARSGEARGATWSEIDMQRKEWRISAERMKNGATHLVPLSDAALKVLRKARGLGGNAFVFPSPTGNGGTLGDATLMRLLYRAGLGEESTVHGFRSSFRTWASECTNADHATMELCLAHAVGSAVERAYARGALVNKRRKLLEAWARAVGAYKSAPPATTKEAAITDIT